MITQEARPAPAAAPHAPRHAAPSMSRWALVTGLVVVLAVVAWSVTEAGDVVLSIPEAMLLGIVEGLTEFLPISSTGHLTVVQDLLGLTETEKAKAAADAYAIAIQAGAIVAVVGIYRRRVANTLMSLVGRGRDQAGGRRMAIALAVGFVPAAVAGLALGDTIKAHLFGTWPVVGPGPSAAWSSWPGRGPSEGEGASWS